MQPDFATYAQIIATLYIALAIEAGFEQRKWPSRSEKKFMSVWSWVALFMSGTAVFIDCLLLGYPISWVPLIRVTTFLNVLAIAWVLVLIGYFVYNRIQFSKQ